MRNPNDDSLLDQVVSLCCLSRYADGRESLCFTVVRICARKLVVRAPLPNHSRTCNAGIDRFTLPILGISLRETARENFGMGERSTEHDTHATFNTYRYTHLSKVDGFMKTWRNFAYFCYYALTLKRVVKCDGLQSAQALSVLYSHRRAMSSNCGSLC